MNDLRGWRTVIINSVSALVGVAAAFGIVLPETLGADVAGAAVAVVNVMNIIIRAFTSTPIGKQS